MSRFVESRLNTVLLCLPAMAVAALFCALSSQLGNLFWFGDEIDLLNQVSEVGMFRWAIQPFAENFVPVFKLLWGSAALLFSGSYYLMVLLLWSTHIVNVLLLSRFLRQLGISIFGMILAVSCFSLSPTIIESLGWSVQWSAVLSMTFFLCAINLLDLLVSSDGKLNSRVFILYLLCGVASALSFSRGVLACSVLGLLPILDPRFATIGFKRRFTLCLSLLLPAVAVAAIIFSASTGNHHGLGQVLGSSAHEFFAFFGNFLLLNPLYRLVFTSDPQTADLFTFGLLKVALFGGALWGTRQNRHLFALVLVFLIFDFGNAGLVSIGRYHTGAQFAVSSRYQYESLLSFAVFLGVLLPKIERDSVSVKKAAFACIILLLCGHFISVWPAQMREWVKWRGIDGRRYLLGQQFRRQHGPVPTNWVGLPGNISKDKAQELITRFNLH